MKKQPLLFFSPCQYFTKSHADYQNHLGDGTWVFVTNIIADYIAIDYPSWLYVLTLNRFQMTKWSGFVENQGFKSDFYSDAVEVLLT
jgi:hypothetical protein